MARARVVRTAKAKVSKKRGKSSKVEAGFTYGSRRALEAAEIKVFIGEYIAASVAPAVAEQRALLLERVNLRASSISYGDLKDEYTALWAEMAIAKSRIAAVDRIVDRIVSKKDRYQGAEALSHVPWYVIALVHSLEASGDFTCHLHNGDPLSNRTVHVPAGRPTNGTPPFTWEESAVDALAYDGLTGIDDWTVEHIAFLLEGFNGWGYRKHHPDVKSPYLWSFSNHYTKGKYIADGSWSPTAVSQQCGAMVLLKRLEERGVITLPRAIPVVRRALEARHATPPRSEAAGLDTFPGDAARMHAFRSWPVQTQLVDGPGIFGYYPAAKRWGTAATVAALYEVGRIWLLRHPTPHPRAGVGDISLKGGGDIDGHGSHETGRDVDMRPIRNDGHEGPVLWSDSIYSNSLTQELIDIIYSNGVVQVKVIGFNDPHIQGCVNWDNHDNHLHVRFFFEDEAPGYPALRFGMNGSPPVREFQRRLDNWYRMSGNGAGLAADGHFGQKTLSAVEAFQSAMGLGVDGVVGRRSWDASLAYIV